MTDRITHERAREIAEDAWHETLSAGQREEFLRYVDQQEKLATRPSPEPSSKPASARDGRAVFVLQDRVNGEESAPYAVTVGPARDWHASGTHRDGPIETRVLELVPREPAQAVDADAYFEAMVSLEHASCGATQRSTLTPAHAKTILAALRSRPAVVDAEVVELAEELDAAFGVGDNGKTFDEAMHEYWPKLSSALRSLVKRP